MYQATYCQNCPLKDRRYLFVPSKINAGADVAFIGEFPIRKLIPPGTPHPEPFMGDTQEAIEGWLKEVRKTWDDASYINVVACCTAPKSEISSQPSQATKNCCHARLLDDIRTANPKKIITFGAMPLKELGIKVSHGIPASWGTYMVYATFHPAQRNRLDTIGDVVRKALNG